MEKQIAELTVERDLAIDRIRLGFADYRYQVWGKIRALKAENRRLAAELATVKAELVAVVVKAALREALKVYADQLRESCDEVSHTFSGMKTTMEKPSGAESEVKT
ncbi:MAG: hypothetical protein LLF96_03100 [Eubacteriales bacterium]|nr:hypothetical protein [Eubacteriales bacterium]